jgi:hypothetical protein
MIMELSRRVLRGLGYVRKARLQVGSFQIRTKSVQFGPTLQTSRLVR